MKNMLLVVPLALLVLASNAQEEIPEEVNLQWLSDDLLGFQDADANYEDLYENLVQILSSPYDLNKVTSEELNLLHLLTDNQVKNLIDYRTRHGKLLDVYELQVIPDFDPEVISRLLPFVKVVDATNNFNRTLLQRMFSADHSYVVSRFERTFETRKGFKQSSGSIPPYPGSPGKHYFRFRSSLPGDFSIGVTKEKDAGEVVRLDPKNGWWGFDFTSYHVQFQHKGKLKNVVMGDFQTQFAQGLVLGGAFGLGKGGETVSTTRKSHIGFSPYTSINESGYQRGIGITLEPIRNVLISAFYSRAKRDASAGADTLTVSSFQTSGLHRTKRELDNRKKVTEQHYGVVFHWNKNALDVGVIASGIHFGIPVRKTPSLHNQYAFTGSKNVNTGIFLNYRAGNVSFFSEAARSFEGGSGGIAGVLMTPDKNLDVAVVYRYYARNFYTFYSNAFSENTQPQNERGVYWGWKYRWSRRYSITGYADLFTFPWLAFRRYSPSSGYEWLLRANYQPSKKVSVFIQHREEVKSRNLPETNRLLYLVGKGLKRNVTLSCDYGIGERIRLKSRMQYNSYSFNKQISEGFALIQDIRFSLGRFELTGRHALFHTDHYDNRLYVYENDAWLAYSLPAYSGIGVRNYALIEYRLHKQLTLWLRYARTRLLKAAKIGSGPETIDGNTKNDVKFQARYKF
jgi:hypothetical protein